MAAVSSSQFQQQPPIEDEEDDFQDACDTEGPTPSCSMDLEAALSEAKLGVNLFFNNKFTEAEALMKPWLVYF